MLDENGVQIELKDDEDEDTYQPGRFRDDFDRYEDYGSESEFADAGYTMKENSDDDDLFAGAEEDESADGSDAFGEED